MAAPAPAHDGEGGWNASGAPGRRTGEMERMRAMVRLLMASAKRLVEHDTPRPASSAILSTTIQLT
jgi:hypothetical protein